LKKKELKVSNETKVGALTAIAITFLILGYNFLKGKNLFNKPNIIYAIYDNTAGLPEVTPVTYKGYQIGSTSKSKKYDKRASKIVVPIILTDTDIEIPYNSIAIISGSALGIASSTIDIKPGNDYSRILKSGDTIATNAPSDMLGEVTKQLNPVLFEVKNAVHSLDSVLMVIGNTFDPNAKSNFQGILGNVNKTTANLIGTSAMLETMLAKQSGNIDKTMINLNTFTNNLNTNNTKINSTLSNIDKASNNFASLNVNEPMQNINSSILELKKVIAKFNNEEGTLGLLMKDPDLYNQMHSLTYSINTLVDDLKVNPKRYISIFGRKDKKIIPLQRPISDTLHR
jgi:phospholipid/cholesterol/gamma-HCH transport system substrate-binding protein